MISVASLALEYEIQVRYPRDAGPNLERYLENRLPLLALKPK